MQTHAKRSKTNEGWVVELTAKTRERPTKAAILIVCLIEAASEVAGTEGMICPTTERSPTMVNVAFRIESGNPENISEHAEKSIDIRHSGTGVPFIPTIAGHSLRIIRGGSHSYIEKRDMPSYNGVVPPEFVRFIGLLSKWWLGFATHIHWPSDTLTCV